LSIQYEYGADKSTRNCVSKLLSCSELENPCALFVLKSLEPLKMMEVEDYPVRSYREHRPVLNLNTTNSSGKLVMPSPSESDPTSPGWSTSSTSTLPTPISPDGPSTLRHHSLFIPLGPNDVIDRVSRAPDNEPPETDQNKPETLTLSEYPDVPPGPGPFAATIRHERDDLDERDLQNLNGHRVSRELADKVFKRIRANAPSNHIFDLSHVSTHPELTESVSSGSDFSRHHSRQNTQEFSTENESSNLNPPPEDESSIANISTTNDYPTPNDVETTVKGMFLFTTTHEARNEP
jgi:hypothetical protein